MPDDSTETPLHTAQGCNQKSIQYAEKWDDWVLFSRYGSGGGKKCGQGQEDLGRECERIMKLLSLQPEWAMFRDMWRDLI